MKLASMPLTLSPQVISRLLLAAVFAAGLAPSAGWAQEKDKNQGQSKWSEFYMYKGPDREQRLIEGTEKEGTLTLYTSINSKDAIPITEAFEKKYGIKVALWTLRANMKKARRWHGKRCRRPLATPTASA